MGLVVCGRFQDHEHLPPQRLDMFQFGVLTPRGAARDFGPHEKKSNWALV